MVCPTISGTTVERRDQVRMTRLSPRRFMSTTLFIRWSSTKGPFLIERGMCAYPLPFPRRRTMSLSDGLGLRVRPSFLPHCFFFNDTATTEIYTLSLHDALPI